jgi:signal transduction histidine kinase
MIPIVVSNKNHKSGLKASLTERGETMDHSKTFQPSISSQISHELRIPLTGILGMAHFLEETSLTSEQKSYLQGIVESANRLLALEGKLRTVLNRNRAKHVI